MDRLKTVISMFDELLVTKRRRHLLGGILLSASFFFGGLALTVISIKKEE